MRRVGFLGSALVVGSLLLLEACGGGIRTPSTSTGSGAQVSFTMTDTPPAGVTVLSFEITVTGATLQPGNVALVSSPIDVEVEKLETETAFLNTASVSPNTYTSIAVTFSNPQLTILNASGSAIAGCANGAVCELKPSLSPATVTVSGPPFPLGISASTPIGLLLDFDLNNSIQMDLSVKPSISFTVLPAIATTGQLEDLDDISGRVTAKDASANQFTLQTDNGMSLTINVNSKTEFGNFNDAGLMNSFSSLAVGQNVEVDLSLMSSGTLVAERVKLDQDHENEENDLEGTIVSVDSPTEFKMVVLDEVPDIAGVSPGNPVTVTIQGGATFNVDADGLSLPSDVLFATSSDLMPGQEVQVRLLSGSSGTSITTDRVTLKTSQFTAKVASISTSTASFTVNGLSTLFTTATPPVTSINVLTSSQTDFDDVSGLSGLGVSDTVSLRGLLFKDTTTPELVAKKVRKRS